jgi:hypothetical protein
MLAFRPKALDVPVVQGEVHKQQPTIEREGHNHQPKKYVGFNFLPKIHFNYLGMIVINHMCFGS